MKKFLIALLIFCCLFIAVVWSVDSKTYGSFVSQKIIDAAHDQGVVLSIEQPRLRLTSFSCSDLGVVLAKPPMFFHSQDALCKFSALNMINGPHIECSGRLYRGTFDTSFDGKWSEDKDNVAATITKLDLKEHPQLLGLGVQSGILSAALRDATIAAGRISSGNIEVQLTDFSKPGETIIGSQLTHLPLDIRIPGIQGLGITLKAKMSPELVSISQGDANSSLGAAHLTGEMKLDGRGQISTLDIVIEVLLSDDGLRLAGPYLPLLGSQAVTAETHNFRVTVKGPVMRPSLVATRI